MTTTPTRATRLDWLLPILPGLIWGASYLFIAEGLEAVAPDGITFLRFVLAFITLSLIPSARRPVLRSDRGGVFWLGVLWLALPMSMFPHAEQNVSSALTGMLTGAVPLAATGVAALRARAVPHLKVLIGLTVGIVGCFLMAVPGLGGDAGSAAGIGMISVAIVCYGIAINIAHPLQQRNGALPVVWRAIGVAMLLTAPLGVPALLHAHWTAKAFAAVLALGVLGTAIANVLMAAAAGRFGPAAASSTSFLSPVVALVLGVVVRHESIPFVAIAGVALCLAGAWRIRSAPNRAASS